MKIKPVILCGGAGTRLWPETKNNIPKQFIDFGGWSLLMKTLERVKNPIFDAPIISTNVKYLKTIKKFLKKHKFKNYTLVAEPRKKNTSPAILSSTLLSSIGFQQPIIFLPSDHYIEKNKHFMRSIKKNLKNLNNENILLFGVTPRLPSTLYGYLIHQKKSFKVTKFIEKPNYSKAKNLLKKKGLWNSGILLAKKISIINHFSKYDNKTLSLCLDSVVNSKIENKTYFLKKSPYSKLRNISIDYAILEKSKNIYAIKLNTFWSDLGNWKEITNIFKKNKKKYLKKKNTFFRPWGKYTNLYYGKGFLIKELVVNPNSSISLQKHNHRSEHWTVASGKPKITLNNTKFFKTSGETVFIKRGSIHRIENKFKEKVKIMEVQIGSILKETDIIRYKDIYGRVK